MTAPAQIDTTPHDIKAGRTHRWATLAVWTAVAIISAAFGMAAGAASSATTTTDTQPLVATIAAIAACVAAVALGHTLLTEHARANLRAWQATHDIRTGLPNRERLSEHFQRQHERRTRNPGSAATTTTIVAYFDLDGFKHVNDTYGHAVGDQLVEAVAKQLRNNNAADVMLARVGGDEFIATTTVTHPATPLTNTAALGGVAARIDALVAHIDVSVNRRHKLEHTSVTTSAAIGVAAGTGDANDLIGNADIAMYHAKRQGAGKHAIYDNAMHDTAQRRRHIETMIRDTATVVERIHAEYQPIVNIETGDIVSYEALARWNTPDEVIEPDEFITIAEDTGAINIIGAHILNEACAQLAQWRTQPGQAALSVAVNLSARQLESDTIVTTVKDALHRHDLPADALSLEITESLLMDRRGRKIERLHTLHDLGVRISIDDFGTGYSSLTYLNDMPVDTLKIDRAFIAAATTSRGGELLGAICDMARGLQVACIAEGIETTQQAAVLAAHGCELGQGYLYAPARTAAAIDADHDTKHTTANAEAA